MEHSSVVKISDNKDNTIEKFSNIDAEIALIGCLLWDNRNFEKISDFLDEIHFVDQNNQIIYKQIKELLNKNILVSPITLKNYLPEKEFGVEITKYLNEVKDSSPSTQNTFQYAKIIYELHLKRSLVGIGQNIIQETFDNGSENTGESLIEIAENDLYNLSNTGSAERKYSKFGDSLKEAVNIINEAFKREGKIAGVASGLRDLDNKLGGLHKSDLIIIAGRPSMGKTALGTNIAFNVAKNFKEKIDEFGSKTLVDGGKVVFFFIRNVIGAISNKNIS